ncbi:MAG: 4Fe-4S dicluster domain-containing protein [Candidatus Baldrarchaeia archaeon]
MPPIIIPEKCSGCGKCVDLCPSVPPAIKLVGCPSKAVVKEPDACLECGVCKAVCPTDAVILFGEPSSRPHAKTQHKSLLNTS